MSRKNQWNYIIITFICLTMMFTVAAATTNGAARLVTFVAAIVFYIKATRKWENAYYLIAAILPDTELLSGSFSGISIMRIMFLLCAILIVIRSKRGIRTLVPVGLYAVWIVYISVNQILINGGFSISNLLSVAGMMIISIALQSLVSENRTAAEKFILMVFVGFSFIVLVAYIELLLGKTFFYSRWTGSERYRYGIMRVGSTVADPNNVCFYLLPFLFWIRMDSIKRIIPRHFRAIVQILTLLIILLTSSRAGLVALLLGVFFCIVGKRKAILLFALPIIGYLSNYMMAAFERLMNSASASTNFRNYVLRQCLTLWNRNKLFGIGMNNIMRYLGYDSSIQNTMNTFVFMLTGLGIIGLAIYVIYWILMVRHHVVQWVCDKVVKNDQLYALACVMTALVLAYTLDTFYMMLMWIIPAMLMAADDQLRMQENG